MKILFLNPPSKSLEIKKLKAFIKALFKKAQKNIIEERGITWAKSVFKDNAGIVSFETRWTFVSKSRLTIRHLLWIPMGEP